MPRQWAVRKACDEAATGWYRVDRKMVSFVVSDDTRRSTDVQSTASLLVAGMRSAEQQYNLQAPAAVESRARVGREAGGDGILDGEGEPLVRGRESARGTASGASPGSDGRMGAQAMRGAALREGWRRVS